MFSWVQKNCNPYICGVSKNVKKYVYFKKKNTRFQKFLQNKLMFKLHFFMNSFMDSYDILHIK